MRRHLFATAVSVALLVGAASPVIAAPGTGKAKGHQHKPVKTKPVKTAGVRVNGGGMTAGGAEFSVQARSNHPRKGQKGHFNYTKAATATTPVVKVRCKSVTVATAAGVQPGDVAATVTGACMEGNGKAATPVSVRATFYDNAAGDRADIVFTRNGVETADSGAVVGEVKVR